MVHPSDDTLLALIHGELDDGAADSARAHLASCGECAARSAALAQGDAETGALLALLDHPMTSRPMPVPRHAGPRWARPAIAASLALLLAGAAAAAVPGTALHRWIVGRFGAAAETPTVTAPVAPAPPTPATQAGGVELPGSDALTVTFAAPEPAGRLTVSVGTQAGAVLHAYGGDVAYQVGKGRIMVDNRRPAGRYTLEVPADLARLTVVVAGRPVFDSSRRRLDLVPDTIPLSPEPAR
jgi:anti-sigma factor RsiW